MTLSLNKFGALALVAAATVTATHAAQKVTLRVAVTNTPITSNTLVFTAPVAKTITWTNATTSTTVLTNLLGTNYAATNLFLQIAANGIGTPRLAIQWVNACTFDLVGAVDQNIAATSSFTPHVGSNWAALTLSTQTVAVLRDVRVPMSAEVGDTNRTNIASLLVLGINDYATNQFRTNAVAMTNFATLGVPYHGSITQRFIGAVTLNSFEGTNRGWIYGGTNHGGVYTNATIQGTIANATYLTNRGYIEGGISITTTGYNFRSSNLVNIGNSLRSDGPGALSLQLGSNAWALGLRGIAIGANAFSTNTDAVAIGTGAISTNTSSVAVGNNARAGTNYTTAIGDGATATGQYGIALMGAAGGDYSISIGNDSGATARSDIAIGSEASATGGRSLALGNGAGASGTNSVAIGDSAVASHTNSMALGVQATAQHTNSIALGFDSETTTNGQIMLGSPSVGLVETYGRFHASTTTNSTFTGTNRIDGDWSYAVIAVTSLANGNNIAVPGTNVVVDLSGPTAAYSINGITGGREGREIYGRNATAYTLTLPHESGVDPTAANRIYSPRGTDETVVSNGVFHVIYSATLSRWTIASIWPTVSVSTNNLAAGSTTQIIYNNGGVEDGASGITVSGSETNLTVSGDFTTHGLTVGSNATVRGSLTVTSAIFAGPVTNSALTASRLMATDANKVESSTITSANVAASVTEETGTGSLVFSNSPTISTPSVLTSLNFDGDTYLVREAADIMAMRDGTSPQQLRFYNTYTDASNYERWYIGWSGDNYARITMERAGTGTARSIVMASGADWYCDASSHIFRSLASTTRWTINSSGHFVAGADNTYDIGATGATRPRNVFVAGNVNTGSITNSGFTRTAGISNSASTFLFGPVTNQNVLYAIGGTKFGSGTTLTNMLTGSAALDFPSTLTLAESDLTITVTGAADGDTVNLGVPNGSVLAGSCFTAWVSAADTVTVRFNNYSAVSRDPASGTFKVSVWKY